MSVKDLISETGPLPEEERGRNLFLSMLGTNAYQPVVYEALGTGEEEGGAQKFIQVSRLKALESRLPLEGKQLDGASIFVTDDAFEKNWKDEGQRNYKTGEVLADPQYKGEKWIGLAESVRREGVVLCPKPVKIPDGESIERLWEIFEIIAGEVEPGDCLYVDVTHGFRTLPMVLLWTLDYVRRVKGVVIEEVSYGAFETKARSDTSSRPTWNLRPFLEIRDWTDAYHQLQQRGDFEPFGRLGQGHLDRLVERALPPSPSEGSPEERKRQGQERGRKKKELTQQLEQTGLPAVTRLLMEVGDALERVRLHQLPILTREACRALQVATQRMEQKSHLGHFGPLKMVLQQVQEQIQPLALGEGGPLPEPGEKSSLKLAQLKAELEAARFLFVYGRHMQSFTLYREASVDLLEIFVQKLALPQLQRLPRIRIDSFSGQLAMAARGKEVQSQNWDEALRRDFEQLVQHPLAREFGQIFGSLTEPRNALDHAHTGQELATKTLKKCGQHLYQRLVALLEQIEGLPQSPEA